MVGTDPFTRRKTDYSKAYNYLDALKRRGYNPRQRRWGRCSLTNCPHIFGLYYNAVARVVPLIFLAGMPGGNGTE